MKFFNIIKWLNIVLTIFFLCLNVVFGIFYIAGFYYFRYSLAVFAYFLVILKLLESVFPSKCREKEQLKQGTNTSKLKEHIEKMLEEEYADEMDAESFFAIDDDFFKDEIFIEDEEKEVFLEDDFFENVERTKTEENDVFDSFLVKNTKKYSPISVPRDFDFVFSNICFLLPKDKAQKLQRDVNYWSPELMWGKLAIFVNDNVTKDSRNLASVRIYAILCNKNESQIRKLFKESGY